MATTARGGLMGRLADRVLALLRRRSRRPSPRRERWLMTVALLVFVGAAVGAWQAFPETDDGFEWLPLLLAGVVGMPLAIVLNALEFQASGWIVDRRVPFPVALRVTVLGSAANVLPIPGSSIVRVRALAQGGVTYGAAISAAAAVGAIFIGTTALVAGVVQLVERPALGCVWIVAGAAVVLLAHQIVRRGAGPAPLRTTGLAMAIEAARRSPADPPGPPPGARCGRPCPRCRRRAR